MTSYISVYSYEITITYMDDSTGQFEGTHAPIETDKFLKISKWLEPPTNTNQGSSYVTQWIPIENIKRMAVITYEGIKNQ